jgi:hypothetical protein
MNEAQLATSNRKRVTPAALWRDLKGKGYQRCGKDIAKIRSCALNEA